MGGTVNFILKKLLDRVGTLTIFMFIEVGTCMKNSSAVQKLKRKCKRQNMVKTVYKIVQARVGDHWYKPG